MKYCVEAEPVKPKIEGVLYKNGCDNELQLNITEFWDTGPTLMFSITLTSGKTLNHAVRMRDMQNVIDSFQAFYDQEKKKSAKNIREHR